MISSTEHGSKNRSSNGNQRHLLRSAITMLLRKDKMQTCVCVCECKVSGRRHIKGFSRQFKKSFRHCEWRRLHIRNLLIFIGTSAGSGAKYGGERRGYPWQGCMGIRRRAVKHGVSNAETGDCARIPE